jgi:transcriptional regulator with XRE-family HTH domain
MAWDYSKLLGRMYECGYNQTSLAKKVKISVPTFSEKLNNKYPFTMKDIDSISNALEIPKSEIGIYFFTRKV